MPPAPPSLLSRQNSLLLIIDPQTRLMPAIEEAEAVTARIGLLIDAARLLDVPVLATEHCPTAIGPLLPALRSRLEAEEILEKRHFGAWAEPHVRQAITDSGCRQIILAGAETHVCVAQTALALQGAGYQTFIASDAVGSRRALDRQTALQRLAQAGVVPVTMEMALFEWLENADHPAFRQVLEIVKA